MMNEFGSKMRKIWMFLGLACFVWACSSGSDSGSKDVQGDPDTSNRQDISSEMDPDEDLATSDERDPRTDILDVTPDESEPPADALDVTPDESEPPADVTDLTSDAEIPPLLLEPMHAYGPSTMVKTWVDQPDVETTITFSYDNGGRLVSMNEIETSDGDTWWQSRVIEYDGTGRLVSETSTESWGEEDADVSIWTYTYGPGGKATSYTEVQQWMGPDEEPMEWTETVVFEYNEDGYIVRQVVVEDGVEGDWSTFVWEDGFLKSFMGSDGFGLRLSYDENGFISNAVVVEEGSEFSLGVLCHADGRLQEVEGMFTVEWTMNGTQPQGAVVCTPGDGDLCGERTVVEFTPTGSSYYLEARPMPADRFFDMVDWLSTCKVF